MTYPEKPVWTVRWNNEVIQAPSAFDILATIGERSFNPQDHKYPKRGIAYRVFVQYQVLIDDDLPDEMFLMKLAEFGLLQLSVSGVAPVDVLQESLQFAQAWHGYDFPDSAKGGK